MADIKDFSNKNKASYLHASHVIVFMQRDVFYGVDFGARASYQGFNGRQHLLPANLVDAFCYVQQAVVAPSSENIIIASFEETRKKIQEQISSQEKHAGVVQALLGMKMYNLFDIFNGAMRDSLLHQIPFLKDMRLRQGDIKGVYNDNTVHSYLNAKVKDFIKRNGGAQWVEIFHDPDVSNVVARRLEKNGFIFDSLKPPTNHQTNVLVRLPHPPHVQMP